MPHEADGTKTRGAVETSSEITHVPDPLHLTVDGGIAEDIQAETISPGQFSRPRKSKSARIDDTTSMARAANDVVLSDVDGIINQVIDCVDFVIEIATNDIGSINRLVIDKNRISN